MRIRLNENAKNRRKIGIIECEGADIGCKALSGPSFLDFIAAGPAMHEAYGLKHGVKPSADEWNAGECMDIGQCETRQEESRAKTRANAKGHTHQSKGDADEACSS